MKTQLAYRQPPLRFRRWSRKRYAAFVSVQHTVTIGHLTAGVSERLQKKNAFNHVALFLWEWTAWSEGRKEMDSGEEEKRKTDSLIFLDEFQLCLNTFADASAVFHLNRYLSFGKHERFSVYATEAFRASLFI